MPLSLNHNLTIVVGMIHIFLAAYVYLANKSKVPKLRKRLLLPITSTLMIVVGIEHVSCANAVYLTYDYKASKLPKQVLLPLTSTFTTILVNADELLTVCMYCAHSYDTPKCRIDTGTATHLSTNDCSRNYARVLLCSIVHRNQLKTVRTAGHIRAVEHV